MSSVPEQQAAKADAPYPKVNATPHVSHEAEVPKAPKVPVTCL